MANLSLRTLGIAYKTTSKQTLSTREITESQLTFLGVVGIEDPLRPESQFSVMRCQYSGVVVRMLTGDSLPTAVKIAKSCNILSPEISED